MQFVHLHAPDEAQKAETAVVHYNSTVEHLEMWEDFLMMNMKI